jgi:hypothetical protein
VTLAGLATRADATEPAPTKLDAGSLLGTWEVIIPDIRDPRLFIFHLSQDGSSAIEVMRGYKILYRITSVRVNGGRFRIEGDDTTVASPRAHRTAVRDLIADGSGFVSDSSEYCQVEPCPAVRARAHGTLSLGGLRYTVDFVREPGGFVPLLSAMYSNAVSGVGARP